MVLNSISLFFSPCFSLTEKEEEKKRKEILPYHKNQPFGFPYQIALIE
jgi:hypothetical protein